MVYVIAIIIDGKRTVFLEMLANIKSSLELFFEPPHPLAGLVLIIIAYFFEHRLELGRVRVGDFVFELFQQFVRRRDTVDARLKGDEMSNVLDEFVVAFSR